MRANGSDGDHATFIADPAGHHADMMRLLLGASPILGPVLDWIAAALRG
jgi:hypothetical protein